MGINRYVGIFGLPVNEHSDVSERHCTFAGRLRFADKDELWEYDEELIELLKKQDDDCYSWAFDDWDTVGRSYIWHKGEIHGPFEMDVYGETPTFILEDFMFYMGAFFSYPKYIMPIAYGTPIHTNGDFVFVPVVPSCEEASALFVKQIISEFCKEEYKEKIETLLLSSDSSNHLLAASMFNLWAVNFPKQKELFLNLEQ